MKFYMIRPELAADVRPHATNVEREPTLHYYGTLELPLELVDRCDGFWQINYAGAALLGVPMNGRLVGRSSAEQVVDKWAEARGLVRYDEERADAEAEAGALYRAETRGAF